MPDEKKVCSDEMMVNRDVICGRTKKRCGVPSLPNEYGRSCWTNQFRYLVYGLNSS